MNAQYPPGTQQGDRPDEISDPDGYMWRWTSADKRGVPGYQICGFSSDGPAGPAHTYGYVIHARYCVLDECHHDVADPGEDVVP